MSDFSGYELYKIYNAMDVSQRQLAKMLGMGFNSLHGKLWRTQEALKEKEAIVEFKQYPRVYLRAAVFDIETTSLKAGGINEHLVCLSILPLDSDEVKTLSIEFSDNRDDRRLLLEAKTALEEYDILIGHNVAAYDFNWLNTRLIYHSMEQFCKEFMYYDTYQAARRQAIAAERKSLAFLGDFFRLNVEKTSVFPVAWHMIDSPVEAEFLEARKDIVDHCIKDVRLNRDLFDALYPSDRGMQNLPRTKKW